jgi:hypothetical protein
MRTVLLRSRLVVAPGFAGLASRSLVWLAVGMAPMALARQTGSWGDQGNGSYKNPILEANYPDNDVIRVGDTFYMMSSTCQFVPGMTILKSKDLVNREFSNPIMPAPITFDHDFKAADKTKERSNP